MQQEININHGERMYGKSIFEPAKNKKVGEIRTDLIDHFNATFLKEGTK